MIFIYSIVKITGTNFGCWMNSAIPVVFVSPSWLGPQFTDPILIQNFVRGIFHVWENGDEDQNNNYCSAILKKTWNSWSTGFRWLQWRWFNCKNTDLYIYILIDWFVNQLWEISMDNHSFVLGLISLEPIFERPGRSHKKAPSRESEHHGVN